MADHRGTPRRSRLPLVAAVLVVVAILSLLTVRLTQASWTAADTVAPGPLAAGNLQVELSPTAGGTYSDTITIPGFGLGDMLPGDSRAATVSVRNSSAQAPLTFRVRGRATTAELATALRVQVWLGGTATNTGSTTTGYSGSCSSTTSLGPQAALAVTDVPLTSGSVGPLAPGAAQTVCVRVLLPADAPQTAQGRSSVITLTVDARSEVR